MYFGILAVRATAPRGDRINWAMGWVSMGIVGNIIFASYAPAKIQTVLGDLNAVWCWAFFLLALLEGFLMVNRSTIQRQTSRFLFALFSLYLINILNVYRNGESLTSSSLYVIILLSLAFYLSPTKENLDGLRWTGLVSMVFIYFLVLTKYNPISINEVTGDVIAGVSGPEYRNFVWSIFGLSDRYSGPFGHPNQLGIFCAFFATVLASSRRPLFRISSIGFLALTFCAASRTSMVVASIGMILVWSRWLWTSHLRTRTRVLWYFIFGAMGLLIIFGGRLGTGRTTKFRESFSSNQINLLYGDPKFYVENSFIYNLFSVGLVAMLIVVYLQIAPLKILWKSLDSSARLGIPLSVQFLIASMGESVVYGSGLNTGTLYLLVLLAIINSLDSIGPSSKVRVGKK